MPEPPHVHGSDNAHFWPRRLDGPSSVAVNGYRSMVMRWFDTDGSLVFFVFEGTVNELSPSSEARGYALQPGDERLPYWAKWKPTLEPLDAPTT